jgi:peptidoglycan hydrolase FlgJ
MAASLTPALSTAATAALAGLAAKPATDRPLSNVQAVAEDFEAVFVNSMLQQMFANVGEGPFSGGKSASVWRSFLTDEYAKSFVKAGGIGIADHVRRAMLARQEVL